MLELIPPLINVAISLNKNKNLVENKNLIKEMRAFCLEQETLLSTVKMEIKALQNGPFEAGLIYLQAAERESEDLKNHYENIKEAKKQFILYLGILNAKSPKADQEYFYIAFAQLYIGLCHLLLTQLNEALYWFKEAEYSIEKSVSCIEIKLKGNVDLLRDAWRGKVDFDNKITVFENQYNLIKKPLYLLSPLVGINSHVTNKVISKTIFNKTKEKNNSLVEKYEKTISDQKEFKRIIIKQKENILLLVENTF